MIMFLSAFNWSEFFQELLAILIVLWSIFASILGCAKVWQLVFKDRR